MSREQGNQKEQCEKTPLEACGRRVGGAEIGSMQRQLSCRAATQDNYSQKTWTLVFCELLLVAVSPRGCIVDWKAGQQERGAHFSDFEVGLEER